MQSYFAMQLFSVVVAPKKKMYIYAPDEWWSRDYLTYGRYSHSIRNVYKAME